MTTTLVDLRDDTKKEEDVLQICHRMSDLSLNFRANRAEIRRMAAEVERLTTDNP